MFGHWTLILPSFERAAKFAAFAGVDLFFVISGFLITGILLKYKADATHSNGFILRQFYIRRFLRIFPLYYLVVFAGLIVHMPGARENAGWLLSYTANWRIIQSDGILQAYTHLWSLSVEEQFYIFFPLLLLLVHRSRVQWLAVAFILAGVASRMFPYFIPTTNVNWSAPGATNSCLDSLGLGILLAWLFANYRKELYKHLLVFKWMYLLPILLAAAGYAFLPLDGILNSISFRLLVSISCFWLVAMAAFGETKNFLSKLLQNRIVVYLGRISYGLYVYHFFMPFIYSRLSFTHSQNPAWVLITEGLFFVSTVISASLSFRFFEKPIIDLKNHFNYK